MFKYLKKKNEFKVTVNKLIWYHEFTTEARAMTFVKKDSFH